MPFDVSAHSLYAVVILSLAWLGSSWALYRTLADMPVHKRTSFYTRSLFWRVAIVLGGLLTVCIAGVVMFVVGGGLLVVVLLCEAYDTAVWFFTKGPGTPFVTSTRDRFRRFTSNAPA